MKYLFIALGIITVIGGFVLSQSDAVQYMKLSNFCIISGITQSVVYFAIAHLYHKSEITENKLLSEFTKINGIFSRIVPKKSCPTCGTEYNHDSLVCPKCFK